MPPSSPADPPIVPEPASGPVPEPGARRRAAVAVALAVGAVGFTTTAVAVGTRGMAGELDLSARQLAWVVNGYLVTAAALSLLGGRLGDVVGRVRTFLLGTAVFAAASLVGVVVAGAGSLIAVRVAQGVGAGLLLPASIEVLYEFTRAGREGREFRMRGLVLASSFAIGPLLGGVLTDALSWRWIFVVDLALLVPALVVAWPLERRHGRGTHRPTHDFAGAALAGLLVAVVVVLAERLLEWGTTPGLLIGGLALAVLLAVVLVIHERRAVHPLLHPSLLRERSVAGANLATLGASLGMLGLLYFFNLFAQSAATFDHAAISVVAALVPFVVAMLLCAQLAHWLGHRVGPRGPTVLGLGLMVVGFALLARTTGSTTETEVFLPLALCGVGAGIANASLTSVAVLHLPSGRLNEAAGWVSLSRFLGSAMALALGTSAFLSVTAPAVVSGASPPPESVVAAPQANDAFDVAAATLARDLAGPFVAASADESAERFARTMGLTALVLTVLTVPCIWLLRPRRSTGAPVSPARAAPEGDPAGR